MLRLYRFTNAEHAAVLAGLRLLRRALDSNPSVRFEGEDDILTDGGRHAVPSVKQIDELAVQFNLGGAKVRSARRRGDASFREVAICNRCDDEVVPGETEAHRRWCEGRRRATRRID